MTLGLWWPRTLLSPRRVTPELVPMVGGGGLGTAVDEFEAPPTGFWEIKLDEIPIASPTQKRVWRALSGLLNGRQNTIAVPIYDFDGAPWPPGDLRKPNDPPFQDSQLFNGELEVAGNVIAATAFADVAADASFILIDMTVGADLRMGMHFSVNDRLYCITQTFLGSPAIWHCQIQPVVREMIPAGTALNFDDPRCLVRLATDQEMETGVDDYAGRTLASVTFREANVTVPPSPTPPPSDADIFLDFEHGTYDVNGTMVAASDITDSPGQIVNGVGLQWSSGGAPLLINDVLTALLTQNFTIVYDLDLSEYSLDNFFQMLAVATSDDSSELGFWLDSFTQIESDYYHSGPNIPNVTANGPSIAAGGKVAMTALVGTSVSLCIAGGTVANHTGSITTPPLTLAMVGDFPGDTGSPNLAIVKSISIWTTPKPDSALPGLTT